MEWHIVAAGMLGLALVLSVSVHAYARLRIERERTLQRLIEHGANADELVRAAGLRTPRRADLRRGLLLVGVGLAWAGVTFVIGGPAWKLGGAPLVIGIVYVVLGMLDDRSR
ncbi:MAG: hypothetical protein QM736_18770 [Vicinamibacterales bacterium]